jgi:STAS domain
MATPARTIVCDAGALVHPHVGTIDDLARLQLAARRRGCELRVRNAPHELRELIAFIGLADVLRLEPVGQAEEREQRVGVEEERQLDDPGA